MKRWRVPLGACVLGASLALAALPVGSASAASLTALAPRVTSPADGSEDTTFSSDLTGVDQMVVQPDGKILVAQNGSPHTLVRLNADGTVDSGFVTPEIATYGMIRFALQADGKIVVAATFTSDYNEPIRRLNADGSQDLTFDAPYLDSFFDVAIQPDGKILIGTNDSTAYVARLNTDGSKDTGFTPPTLLGFDKRVLSVAVQPDGKIMIAGNFTGAIKRLNADGSIDTGFTETAAPPTYPPKVVIQRDGKILVGLSGTGNTNNLTRFNADGTVDTGFTPPGFFGTGSFYPGLTIAIQFDDKILVGSSGGTVKRLNTDGTEDTTFDTGALFYSFDDINALTIQPNGNVLVGSVYAIKRLNNTGPVYSDGTLDLAFSTNLPALDDSVLASAVQADGKILIGGKFTGGLKRLNADGTEDTGFTSAVGANVGQIVVLSDGKILVAGSFTGNLKRLNSDGSEDTGFTPAVTGGILGVQIDGKVLVAGSFAGYLKRLNADGTEDTSFTPPALDNFVYVGAVQADGKILIGGFFTDYLKRLNPDGTIDGTFTPPAFDGDLISLTVQPNGKILIGGFFTGHLKRLNYDGSNDDGFTPPALDGWNESQQTIAVQADGKIVIGGYFTGYLLRLNADGTLDAPLPARPSRLAAERDGRIQANAFTPPSFSGGVNSVLILPDGSILVGGVFAGHLVRLGASGATPPPVLPPTGADTTVLVVFAVILLAAGTVLVTSRRRSVTLR